MNEERESATYFPKDGAQGLEGSLVPVSANRDHAELLPLDTELLAPKVIDWSLQRDIHKTAKAISALEHVAWFYFAQCVSHIYETKRWNEVAPSFSEYCSEYLGRKPEYVSRALNFLDWIKKHAPQDYKFVPRYRTMGLISNFREAFLKYEELRDLVFNQGCNDRDILMGAIKKHMGMSYVAQRVAPSTKSRRYGGSFKPEPTSVSQGIESSVALLLTRLETILVKDEAWSKIRPELKQTLARSLDNILRKIVGPDTLPYLRSHYDGSGTQASEPLEVDGLEEAVDADCVFVKDVQGISPLTENEIDYLSSLNPELVLKEHQVADLLGKTVLSLEELSLPFKPAGSTRYVRLKEVIPLIIDISMVRRLENIIRGAA